MRKPLTTRVIIFAAASGAVLLAGATLALVKGKWPPIRCAELGLRDETRLITFIHTQYRLPPSVQVAVADAGTENSACYHRLVFESVDGIRNFHEELIASPDFQFLSSNVLDARPDPQAVENQRRDFASALVRGNLPAAGPEEAPATLAIFSDFQCPYCASLAHSLHELSASGKLKFRVVFHYLPLSIHNWARPAAEAAACAHRQSDLAFWNLHDYFFAHQTQLSAENLPERILEQVKTISGLNQQRFKACLEEHQTADEIAQDLKLSAESGIHATPTLFLNGEPVVSTGTDELRTLIRRISP